MPANSTEASEAEALTPVIVDLGKVKRKRIKQLKRGIGPLVDEVSDLVDAVCDRLGDEAEGKTILPVVILYRRKSQKKRFFW